MKGVVVRPEATSLRRRRARPLRPNAVSAAAGRVATVATVATPVALPRGTLRHTTTPQTCHAVFTRARCHRWPQLRMRCPAAGSPPGGPKRQRAATRPPLRPWRSATWPLYATTRRRRLQLSLTSAPRADTARAPTGGTLESRPCHLAAAVMSYLYRSSALPRPVVQNAPMAVREGPRTCALIGCGQASGALPKLGAVRGCRARSLMLSRLRLPPRKRPPGQGQLAALRGAGAARARRSASRPAAAPPARPSRPT